MELSVFYGFVVAHALLLYHGSNGLPTTVVPPANPLPTTRPATTRHKKTRPTTIPYTGVPMESMTTCAIIKYYGYPCEIHEVTTFDGYILELHRLPHGMTNATKKGVAFLQHGLLDSSFTWTANPPNQSLAYILADNGYDVWMGNSRGNTYSRKHTILKTSDQKFWDFSFDEFAKYDNPASLDFVLKATGEEQVHYIGHSQGTMMGFAGFSTIPKLAKKIKIFIALAPVAHVYHIFGVFKVLSKVSGIAHKIVDALGTKNFIPNSWVIKALSKIVCKGISSSLCGSIIFLIAGYNSRNLNDDRIPIYTSHTPAGTSVKDVLHFNQLIKTDTFKMYDYGWNENMRRYLQPFPPSYPLHKMKVPVALFVGENDWLATPPDINLKLRGVLPHIVYDQDIEDWNHMDFVWGRQANEVLYENVMKVMQGGQP